jgi:hypothetical protein
MRRQDVVRQPCVDSMQTQLEDPAMADRRNEELSGHAAMPVGVGGLGGMRITGDREDPGLLENNERLEELPDHENDHLRGTDDSQGAGVVSAGGTARETGESSDSDREPGEDRDAEPKILFPVPVVGGPNGR